MREKIIRIQQKIYHAMSYVGGFMVLVAAVFACINAISRYVFNYSFSWAEELCTVLCVLAVFFVYAWLETENQQLCIDIVTSKLKNEKTLLVMYVIRGIVTLFITAIIIWYGLQSIGTAFELGNVTYVLKIPRFVLYGVVVFGYICVEIGWISVLCLNKGRKF